MYLLVHLCCRANGKLLLLGNGTKCKYSGLPFAQDPSLPPPYVFPFPFLNKLSSGNLVALKSIGRNWSKKRSRSTIQIQSNKVIKIPKLQILFGGTFLLLNRSKHSPKQWLLIMPASSHMRRSEVGTDPKKDLDPPFRSGPKK